jgi:two-component system heavy metal sensor histidine kinase CusS
MVLVFGVAVAWAVLVASWIVRRMTRDYNAVANVARQVAAGDLSARVGPRSGDPETAQLARDVDAMIERLGMLLTSQRHFIAHAAHELRSPLTTLYGELSLARRRSRDAKGYEDAIDEALDSARRLKLLADDLLVLARLGAEQAPATQPVVLESVIRAAVDEVEKLATERHVAIDVESEEGVSIEGYPNDLERMARNLIDNAVRHSPEGGRVRVSVRRTADRGAQIVVRDRGPGIPDADAGRVFEPFFRGSTDRAGSDEGAGLGLAIVREIARAHGGDVVLEKLPEGESGACFAVRVTGVPGRDEPSSEGALTAGEARPAPSTG